MSKTKNPRTFEEQTECVMNGLLADLLTPTFQVANRNLLDDEEPYSGKAPVWVDYRWVIVSEFVLSGSL